MNNSEAQMQERDNARVSGQSETRVKQGAGPKWTLWVLLASLALAVVVGVVVLTDHDEVPPSEPRSAIQSPATGSPPAAPQAEPKTAQ